MRNLHFTVLLSLLIAACSSTENPATCAGTPPVVCDGCCGTKYAADQCLNGAWTCRPTGDACVVCDAGADSAPGDASGDAAMCTGTPPVICDGCCGTKYAADQCLDGAWTCRPSGAACVMCDAGTDSAPGDAATCPRMPPGGSLDEEVAYLCSRPYDGGNHLNVGVSTMECGGVLAVLQQDGIDTETLYLFDPTTKDLLEVASGANGLNDCVSSVSGVPLATSCLFAVGYQPFDTAPGTFGFRDACATDAGIPADANADAPADSASGAPDAGGDR
jgi:hypothetical protein